MIRLEEALARSDAHLERFQRDWLQQLETDLLTRDDVPDVDHVDALLEANRQHFAEQRAQFAMELRQGLTEWLAETERGEGTPGVPTSADTGRDARGGTQE